MTERYLNFPTPPVVAKFSPRRLALPSARPHGLFSNQPHLAAQLEPENKNGSKT